MDVNPTPRGCLEPKGIFEGFKYPRDIRSSFHIVFYSITFFRREDLALKKILKSDSGMKKKRKKGGGKVFFFFNFPVHLISQKDEEMKSI